MSEIAFIKSPLGITKIVGDENGVSIISILEEGEISTIIPDVLIEVVNQLEEYFDKKRSRLSPKH